MFKTIGNLFSVTIDILGKFTFVALVFVVASWLYGCGGSEHIEVADVHYTDAIEGKTETFVANDEPQCVDQTLDGYRLSERLNCETWNIPPMLIVGTSSAVEAIREAANHWNASLGYEQFRLQDENSDDQERAIVRVEWTDERAQTFYEESATLGGAGIEVDNATSCTITSGVVVLRRDLDIGSSQWLEIQTHELGHVLGLGHHDNSDHLMFGGVNGCADPDTATIELVRSQRLEEN